MDNIKNIVANIFNNKKLLVIILSIIILLGVALYVYNNYVKTNINKENKPYQTGEMNQTNDKVAEVYFFYTEWCPHCKKAKPEWSKLVSSLENKEVNGYNLLFKSIDCDKEASLAEKFNVEGYPTIKLVKDGQVIEYDAKPNYETLTQFLQSVL